MSERQVNEQHYLRGEKAAYRRMLGACIQGLRMFDEPLQIENLMHERAEAIAMLRIVCGEHGDNDWQDNLHLADIIDKHLARHLPEPEDEDEEE